MVHSMWEDVPAASAPTSLASAVGRAPSKAAAPAKPHGRRNSLGREGINSARRDERKATGLQRASSPRLAPRLTAQSAARESEQQRLFERRFSSGGAGDRAAREATAPAARSPRAPAAAARGRVALGDGWWALGDGGGAPGTMTRSGLHHQIESRGPGRYVAAFEPRAPRLIEALYATRPAYDLSVSAKAVRHPDPGPKPRLSFAVALGLSASGADCYLVTANVSAKRWTLEKVRNGRSVGLVQAVDDTGLKSNFFYQLLVQVRGDALSVDANGVPVFTSVKVDGGLCGLSGVVLHASKCVIKHWRLEPCGPPPPAAGPPPPPPPLAAARGQARSLADVLAAASGPPAAPAPAAQTASASAPAPAAAAATDGTEPTNAAGAPALPPGMTLEERRMAMTIEADIIDRSLGVTFDDVVGLDRAKTLLDEAVVLPMLMPEFFTGIRAPWRGVLLFGPPGTGKTMLAKAVAGVNGATFFNVSTATLVSKYRGESEKLLRTLFALARHHAPSVIFFDEIDALVSQRGGAGEHEASRRLKSELLMQMDGVLDSAGSGGHVLVLAATNCPWDLDEAMRRRLEKRVYAPLPNSATRDAMFEKCLASVPLDPDVGGALAEVARCTQGLSGADVHLVCREAAMMPMRRLVDGLSPAELAAMRGRAADAATPAVGAADLVLAAKRTRPSVSERDVRKHEAWDAEYGVKSKVARAASPKPKATPPRARSLASYSRRSVTPPDDEAKCGSPLPVRQKKAADERRNEGGGATALSRVQAEIARLRLARGDA